MLIKRAFVIFLPHFFCTLIKRAEVVDQRMVRMQRYVMKIEVTAMKVAVCVLRLDVRFQTELHFRTISLVSLMCVKKNTFKH